MLCFTLFLNSVFLPIPFIFSQILLLYFWCGQPWNPQFWWIRMILGTKLTLFEQELVKEFKTTTISHTTLSSKKRKEREDNKWSKKISCFSTYSSYLLIGSPI
jgi:hypothetical protein